MTDFAWPDDVTPFRVAYYLQPHVGRSVSPFTRQQKIYQLSQPLWIAQLSLRGGYDGESGVEAYGPRLDALIAQLEGGAHRIAIWDFRRPGAAAAFSNDDIALGESQVTLLGTTDGLQVGDYIGGDGRPHIVVSTEVDGSDLIVDVRPHFQTAVAAGDATYENVAGYFRLVSDDAGANPTTVGDVTTYELGFVEDPGPSTDVIYEGEPVTYSG